MFREEKYPKNNYENFSKRKSEKEVTFLEKKIELGNSRILVNLRGALDDREYKKI